MCFLLWTFSGTCKIFYVFQITCILAFTCDFDVYAELGHCSSGLDDYLLANTVKRMY